MSVVIDTNVLLFDTFEDSEYHDEATAGLEAIERWCLPSMVFHELVWFFRGRKIQASRAALKVDEYMTSVKAVFHSTTADDIGFAATRMKSYHEYNDLVILSAARRLELPLFTFDEDLKKAAGKNAVRLFQP